MRPRGPAIASRSIVAFPRGYAGASDLQFTIRRSNKDGDDAGFVTRGSENATRTPEPARQARRLPAFMEALWLYFGDQAFGTGNLDGRAAGWLFGRGVIPAVGPVRPGELRRAVLIGRGARRVGLPRAFGRFGIWAASA